MLKIRNECPVSKNSAQLDCGRVDVISVITALLSRIVDFVVPQCCASCESPVRGNAVWCFRCADTVAELPKPGTCFTPQGHRVLAPFVYQGSVARAIQRLKFSDRPELARALGFSLANVVELADIPADSLIVPVPLSAARLVERGYNQSALLASALSRKVGLRCRPTALRRMHSAPHQVGANKASRAQQVAGAFMANRKIIQHANVVLLDDVVTTGATSAACAAALKAVNARLVAIVAVARVL